MSELAVFPGASSEDEMPFEQPAVPFDQLAAFYAYLQRNRDAEAKVREEWAKKPGFHSDLSVTLQQPWEQENFNDTERQQVWVGAQMIKMNTEGKIFSQAAALIATSHERAQFYDDIMCDYVGDPQKLGQFREISPRSNHTAFSDIDFDYNKGVLNAFAGDKIIHIRETSDPTAQSRSQKLFVVVANLMTMEIQRLYADDKPHIESMGAPELHFNEIIPLTSRTLQNMEVNLGVVGDDPLQPYLDEFSRNQQRAMQPQLIKSANNGWLFKPEGYAERSKLQPIEHLAYERGVLWALAQARGLKVSDRGVLIQTMVQPGIEQ